MAYGYDEQEYRPLRGRALEEVKAFLARQGLTWEADVTYTVLLRDSTGRLAATASLQEDVIKCVAVAEDLRGEGLTATVLTAVRRGEAVRLRQKCKEIDPHSFMFITNTSEIIGKGFRSD